MVYQITLTGTVYAFCFDCYVSFTQRFFKKYEKRKLLKDHVEIFLKEHGKINE